MKETKQFLNNQIDIYNSMFFDHLKTGKINFVHLRDIANLIISNTITLKGIEEAHPSKVNKTKKK